MRDKNPPYWGFFLAFALASVGVVLLHRGRGAPFSTPQTRRLAHRIAQAPEPSPKQAEAKEETEQDQPRLTDLQGDLIPRGAIARLGTSRFRPLSFNYSYIAFSPDGKFLLSDGYAGLYLWDAATGKRVEWFRDAFAALAACFSPDGRTLIAGDSSGTLRRWQMGTGKLLQESKPRPDGNPWSATSFFSADGMSYGIMSYNGREQVIRLWDVATGRPFLHWEPKVNRFSAGALSPDGNLLVVGGQGNLVHLIDTATGKEVRRIEGWNKLSDNRTGMPRDDSKREVHWFTFLPDSRLLAGMVRDDVCIWDVATGKLRYQIKSGRGRVAFSPDGKYLACGNDKGMHLYDIASGKEVRCLDPSFGHDHPAAFSPDGKTLAELCGPTIRLWDTATGKPRHHFPGHQNSVNCLAFSPDGTSLASGDDGKIGTGGAVLVWDLATRKPRHVFPGHTYGVTSLAYSPDGKLLASGNGVDNSQSDLEAKIRIWDLQNGRLRHEFFAHLGSVQSLAFSPNGKVLASAGFDQRVKLWDVASGERLRQIRSEEGHIKSVAFSPDGKFLILTDLGGKRAAWNMDSGQKVRDLKAVDVKHWTMDRTTKAIPSPDGKTVATNSGYYGEPFIQLWDVETEDPLIQLRGHRGGAITALAFSPDGRILASGARDTTVLLWDVSKSRLAKRQNTH